MDDVVPSPKRDRTVTLAADRLHAVLAIIWVGCYADRCSMTRSIAYICQASVGYTANAGPPYHLQSVPDVLGVDLDAESEWCFSDILLSGKTAVCSSLSADLTVIFYKCFEYLAESAIMVPAISGSHGLESLGEQREVMKEMEGCKFAFGSARRQLWIWASTYGTFCGEIIVAIRSQPASGLFLVQLLAGVHISGGGSSSGGRGSLEPRLDSGRSAEVSGSRGGTAWSAELSRWSFVSSVFL